MTKRFMKTLVNQTTCKQFKTNNPGLDDTKVV